MGIGGSSPYLIAILSASGLFAADVQRFVVSQVRPQLPVMTAYLDIVDAGGQPVADLKPASFSAALGANSAQVTGVKPFLESGEGVAYAFLVDVSGSLKSTQFDQIRGAIQTWIAGLKPLDRAAIAAFGEDYHLVADFTADKDKLSAALNALAPRDAHTRLYKAIDQALGLAERVDAELPTRRVLVLLSDGKDEGSALTPDDILLKIRASRLPLYTIGVSELPKSQRQRYLDVLHRFSNASGGLFAEAAGDTVPSLYAAIQQAILRVFVAGVSCPGCPADGRAYPLELTVTQGARGLKAESFDVVPLPAPIVIPPAKLPARRTIPLWAWLVAAVAVIGAVGVLVLRRRPEPEFPPIEEVRARSATATSESTSTSTQEDEAPSAGLPMKVAVVIGKGAGSAQELTLESAAIIGRGPDCDVIVPDPQVSNHHCKLALLHGQVVVYDLNSTNATYVNGVPIRGHRRLEPLDIILVGDTELRIHFEER